MENKRRLRLLILMLTIGVSLARAQTSEVTQLLLNVEKLSQFREILQQMHDGYRVLKVGYQAVRDVAEGNFSLHRAFLEGLFAVHPNVRNYRRVGEIIDYQVRLVGAHQEALYQIRDSRSLRQDELRYITRVFRRLLKQSLNNLDELIQVITANHLRMNDEERLAAIDRIYQEVQDKFLFFKDFHAQTSLLILQRSKQTRELDKIRRWYDEDQE